MLQRTLLAPQGVVRRSAARLGRAKGGQLSWSPNKGPSANVGGSTPQVVTADELLTMSFRPLPRDCTVDYEEDYGTAVMIQREYVAKRARDAVSGIHGLGFSETEQRDMRRTLASTMNQERNMEALTSSPQNAVQFQTSPVSGTPAGLVTAVESDEMRRKYLDRFERHMGGELRQVAEACAVLFGVDDAMAREAWLSTFLGGMDAMQLNKDADKATSLIAEAEDLEADMSSSSTARPDDSDDGGDEGDHAEGAFSMPLEYADFAPLYRNFASYCRGEVPAAAPGTVRDTAGLSTHISRRHQWRALLDRLVGEQYETIGESDLRDLRELNEQLNTSRLLGTKIDMMVNRQASRIQATDNLPPGAAVSDSNPMRRGGALRPDAAPWPGAAPGGVGVN